MPAQKPDNLKAAVALHFAHYKLMLIHKTLRSATAIGARTDWLWPVEELLAASLV
ncbi:MAG TPA: hypothetical protein VKC60_03700 [Opitutaceae bacterium]|nr:hypothetical protein [Opitutaceae bacterium]